MGDFIDCNVAFFLMHPVIVIHLAFMMISVDKVIAIKFPFEHRQFMTNHFALSLNFLSWLLAIAVTIPI